MKQCQKIKPLKANTPHSQFLKENINITPTRQNTRPCEKGPRYLKNTNSPANWHPRSPPIPHSTTSQTPTRSPNFFYWVGPLEVLPSESSSPKLDKGPLPISNMINWPTNQQTASNFLNGPLGLFKPRDDPLVAGPPTHQSTDIFDHIKRGNSQGLGHPTT